MTTVPGFPSPSSGSPDQFRVPWETFVQLVMAITVKAYQRMRQDGVARRDWEEDTFSICLTEDYIEPLARRDPLSLVAMARTRVHTLAMKTGTVSPKRASEIDIRLFSSWMNHGQVYFAWECKRVGDKRVNARYAALIPKYVTEGMLRFIDEQYSAGLPDAGMLGYVLAGDVPSIVNDINASMYQPRRSRPLSGSDHLNLAPPVGSFKDVYKSHHQRPASGSNVRLHHLFLTFDFQP